MVDTRQAQAIIRAIDMLADRTKPRLAIVTTIARADFCEPLRWLDRFDVWHFYMAFAPDIRTDRLSGHYVKFRDAFELLLGLLKLRPDLIQGSEPYDFPPGFLLSCAALLGAGLLRRPFYFPTFENIPPDVKYCRRRSLPVGIIVAPLLRSFMARYSRRCSFVFAGNEGAVRNLLAVHTPPKRIRRELYATWGVDLDLFSPSGARSVEIHHPHTILFVGRLVEQKGVRELLRAFSLVLEQEADAALVFIGDGPLGGEIRRFMRDHCTDDRIRLLGIIPNSELPPYFRAAEITVVPSLTQPVWSEQVGMVAIQSMACGTPVITTNSGSIPEFVQDGITGLLVPERNPEAMAGAILELLRDDRLRRKLATSGRAYAEKRYDAASNVAKVQDILLQLLARTRPSAFACPNRANQSGPGPESEDSRST